MGLFFCICTYLCGKFRRKSSRGTNYWKSNPYAQCQKENDEALNRSYVFASAQNFNEAATRVIKGLEDNGYSKSDFIGIEEVDKYSDPLEAKKAIKKDLKVPIMAIGKEKLSFEDLLGEDFELAKQNADFDFKIHYDLDGQATIDITEEDEWLQGKQLSLPYQYFRG